MATGDIQIVAGGIADAPLDYTVPGAGEIQPKVITATFDGTFAATPFLPMLEIISDGGVVVARCPAPQVSAGGRADVSWFPHVADTAAASVPSVGSRIETRNLVNNIPDTTWTDIHYGTSRFDTDGMVNLVADDRILTVNTAGIYLVTATVSWPHHTAGRRILAVTHNDFMTNAAIADTDWSFDTRMAVWAPPVPVGPESRSSNTVVGVWQASPGDFFASGAFQASYAGIGIEVRNNCYFSALMVGA